jgi:hypothetical protein
MNTVVELYNDGYTPEMQHDHFPSLSLALIHKVIAFYLGNQTLSIGRLKRCLKKNPE